MGSCSSGQRGLTVNQLALPSVVRIHYFPLRIEVIQYFVAGVAQLVERQPSKLKVAGSRLVSRSKKDLMPK